MLRASARAAVAILIGVLLSSLGVVAGPAMADTTDVTPPGQVTNLQMTTGYRSVVVNLTEPTDVDYGYYVYAIAPGGDVPPRPSFPWRSGPAFIASGLSMGTDYTLAVWSVDRSGNASAPVVDHFTTLLDTQPPHPVTGLTLTGSAYKFIASWTPPTDSDLQELDVTETDNTTGTVRSFLMGKTATGYTRREPGGHTFTIAVTALDTNGLVSDVSSATAQTDPDDGAPPPVAPSSVTFSPTSGDLWISFPRPALPDLAALG